jgi:hypothetical protein
MGVAAFLSIYTLKGGLCESLGIVFSQDVLICIRRKISKENQGV